MSKTFRSFIILITALFFFSTSGYVSAQSSPQPSAVTKSSIPTAMPTEKIRVIYFYAADCSKCQKIKPFIDDIKEKYKDKIDFLEHDVKSKQECLQLFLQFIKAYNLPSDKASVPLVFIGKDYLLGVNDIENNLESKINEKISNKEGLLLDCHKFLEDWEKGIRPDNAVDIGTCSATSSQDSCSIVADPIEINTPKFTVPSVFVVGFLAGFNPCLLAILAFIASVTLASTGKRRNVILIVIMFSLGIFVTYLIVGVGLLKVIDESPGLQNTIKTAVIALISFLGIWQIYDAYHLRKNEESSFYTPKAFVRLTENMTKNVNLPAAFFMGSLFSLIKAPCVGAVYLMILDMVRNGQGGGMIYLASYNLGVVFPVLVLGTAIAFGANPEKIEKFRKERRSALRFVTGAALLIIAILMYMGTI